MGIGHETAQGVGTGIGYGQRVEIFVLGVAGVSVVVVVGDGIAGLVDEVDAAKVEAVVAALVGEFNMERAA